MAIQSAEDAAVELMKKFDDGISIAEIEDIFTARDAAIRAEEATKAMIEIAELPPPESTAFPEKQLVKLKDPSTAISLGYSMGIMAACQYLRARATQPAAEARSGLPPDCIDDRDDGALT